MIRSGKNGTMRSFIKTILFLFFINNTFAQIVISPLSSNPELTSLYEQGKLKKASAGDKLFTSLHLPFIDDFSKNHQPGATKVLWEDNFVFINPTYGVNPPTIGVATFDGLDFNGYPYNFDSPTSYGDADVFTSCPINLSEDADGDPYAPSDSIYLSFYYQAQGLGDFPEANDSLILEFYNAETDFWSMQWSMPGQELNEFQIVYIPIVDDIYFSPDFKFRFRNKATLSGNVDHWNIDMVWIDKNRSVNEVGFPDVGFQYPVNQLLNTYTAIPYSHYQLVSGAYMANSVPAQLRNNNNVAINLSNVKMLNYSEGSLVNETPFPGNIENFPAQSSATYGIPLYDGTNGYVFDPNIDETFVSFENEFVMTSGTFDLVEDNDTISFTQQFRNYYAYDDGSAEAGIGTNVSGGRLLNKYQSIIGDSLIAFTMYFNPIVYEPVYPFFMVVYNDDGGFPGDLIHIDQDLDFVTFIQEGHDIFAYYWLDSAVYVNGDFYIGISQTSSTSLNLGLDRNIDSHENMFYNIGAGWSQMPSSISGSLMMRPVFQSDLDSIILGIDERVELQTRIYPNPASDRITVKCENEEWIDISIYSMDGRQQLIDRFIGRMAINVGDFSEGMYIIQLRSASGIESTHKIIVRH